MKANACAAQSATAPLAPFGIRRRGPGAHDVQSEKINEAYERVVRHDVKYRFVIELASLKAP
jgi:hypothetical protein